MSNITDKSLLRCTLKKSADVFAKLVLYASYAVCGVTALVLAVYGMLVVASVIADPIRAIINAVWNWKLPELIFTTVVDVLAAIPWYVYVGIAVVAAIPVYSLLWCVARELTEEDYQSKIAKNIAEILGLVVFVVLVLVLVLGMVLVLGVVLVLVLVLVLGMVLGMVLEDTKVFLFLGAYLHYRERVKEERK